MMPAPDNPLYPNLPFGPQYLLVDPETIDRDLMQVRWTPKRDLFFFDGFIPGMPLVAGVFMADSQVQAIASLASERPGVPVLRSLKRIRLRGRTHPQDTVVHQVSQVKTTRDSVIGNVSTFSLAGNLVSRTEQLHVQWVSEEDIAEPLSSKTIAPPPCGLPHPRSLHPVRDPCEYIDYLTSYEVGVKAEGIWAIRHTDPYVSSHTPELRFLPSAVVLESAGQAGICATVIPGDDRLPLPGGANDIRVHQLVPPSGFLQLFATTVQISDVLAKAKVRAFYGEALVCEATVIRALVELSQLPMLGKK